MNSQTRPDSAGTSLDPRRKEQGQILVIFAGAMIALMMLMALVVDIGWYWSSGLKIQRAADAAALAGAVYLPDDYPAANAAALAAAKRNGYVPDADTTITTTVDSNNARQLDVTINDKVGTLFMKVIGIQTLNASKSSKAEFVLPVPMGSPQNYYGIGSFSNLVTPQNSNPFTNAAAPTAWTAGAPGWSSPANAYSGSNVYSTSNSNNTVQVWKTFNFGAFQAGAVIDGMTLSLELKDSDTSGCAVAAELSWDKGVTWGNLPQATPGSLTASDTVYTLGLAGNDAAWGSNHPNWVAGDFTTANNFQVRLTYLKGASCSGTVSLDQINATVYSHTITPGTPVETPRGINPPGTSPTITTVNAPGSLASQGFWGAVITKGGDRQNGDQFDPANDPSTGGANPDFDGKGVDYTVSVGSSGQVQIFDPSFCATGPNASGGYLGTGDHWMASGSTQGVTTVFSLYNQNGTPYAIDDDTKVATSDGSLGGPALFNNESQADYSGSMGTPATNGAADCANAPYHNKWWPMASGLAAGNYRLNVSTNVSGNNSTSAENLWSLWAGSTGSPKINGQGQMVAYTNLANGTSLFYLAQIDKAHAGKTLEIHLFDPDSMTGSLKIKSPNGNVYNYVNFSWTASNGMSGNNVNSIAITPSGFNDQLVTITIALPGNYGSTGLTPAGESSAGWWKIEYNVSGGNDTTTWAVDIRGNPVHLLAP